MSFVYFMGKHIPGLYPAVPLLDCCQPISFYERG